MFYVQLNTTKCYILLSLISFEFYKMLHLQGKLAFSSEIDVHLIKCQINCTMKDD